ncbi:MAG: DUF2796 domain-containing protein [Alphaproteobacteria bacterium]|nr:DUF2796 domain-containing protein [Alphaproteobacteria bacterium]
MRLINLCALGAASTLLINPAFAEQRRELGAHVHGHSVLNMAVDGNKIGFDLRAPGADIVGFEHEAKSEADKKALNEAKLLLRSPLELFSLTKAAGCKLSSSFAHYTKDPDHAEHHKKHHGPGHDKNHGDHGHSKHKGHDHDKHDGHAKHEGHDHDKHHGGEHSGHQGDHAEFHAGYEFTCAAPKKLTQITFSFFKEFKNARELEVTVATAKGQSKFEVTAAKPTIDLGTLMQ